MNYFVLIYRVLIDEGYHYSGKVVRATKDTIFIEREIIPYIEKRYVDKHPEAIIVKVNILKIKKTTFTAYQAFLRSCRQKTNSVNDFYI